MWRAISGRPLGGADAVLDDAAAPCPPRPSGTWLSTGASAIFGWISSVIRSSFQPSASAIIATDSVSPTWRTVRAFTFSANSAGVRPEPIFCWKGRRRMRASWTRSTLHRVHPLADGGEGDGQGVHGEAGVHPGADHGHLRLLRRRVDLPREGPVREPGIGELLGGGDDRHLELQHRLDLRPDLLEGRAGAEDGDLRPRLPDGRGRVGPDLDARSSSRGPPPRPRSLPALAGSMSTAATTLKFFRAGSWRATPAPIGPRPMIITVVGMAFRLLEDRLTPRGRAGRADHIPCEGARLSHSVRQGLTAGA